MAKPFFDLHATHNPHRWFLPLTRDVCVGKDPNLFMFGGVGLGSAIAAMERTCERPVIWATAQYLSFARPGSVVDLDVTIPVHGHNTTQARVVSHVGDKEILTVNAALGRRPGDISQCWRTMPAVARPEDSALVPPWDGQTDTVHVRIEMRTPPGPHSYGPLTGQIDPEGRVLVWLRFVEGQRIDASLLAVLADYMPSAMSAAMGRPLGGNSLDNTLRVRRIVETEWVLGDIHVTSLHNGFGYGEMDLYAEGGELMATASQSVILRVPSAGKGERGG